MGQLRIREQAIGNEAAAGRAIATIEMTQDNAKVVLSDMRELGAAGTFAHGPHKGGGGLEPLIHPDVTAHIELNAGLRSVDSIGVGHARPLPEGRMRAALRATSTVFGPVNRASPMTSSAPVFL